MENIELSRTKAQQKALSALYGVLTYLNMQEPLDVESLVSGVTGKSYADSDLYVKGIVIAALKHLNEIIPLFQAHMSKWTFARLNRVEQAILLLAYCHYYYVEPTVDKGVVIDIAVRFAKTYLDGEDYKFVNAILDKVLTREK
jgi:transcription antitermination factor NusB